MIFILLSTADIFCSGSQFDPDPAKEFVEMMTD